MAGLESNDLTPEEVLIALIDGELKTLKSIADHTPRQDGSGMVGVSSATALQWIQRGNLRLKRVLIDGATFYHVPRESQHRPDWGLALLFRKRRAGRPSHQDLLCE